MMLESVFGNNLLNADKCKNTLIKAMKDKNYEDLSELTGTTIEDCKKAINSIKNILTKQAEEQGITFEKLVNNLNNLDYGRLERKTCRGTSRIKGEAD